MLPDYFALVGAFVSSLGGFFYLYETLIGTTRPNRITWLLWGIFPLVIFAAQRAQGVGGMSWVSFVSGLTPLLIIAASFFNKKAYWKSEPRDYFLMALALGGIVLWALTDNPNLALLFSLLADVLAAIPTIIKAYREPESESWIAYSIGALGFAISLLSIQRHSLENSAFVICVLVLNGLLALLAARGRAPQRLLSRPQ